MSTEQSDIVTLENNLKLQLVSIPGSKTAFFAVGFHAGSIYEEGFGPGSNDGVSHFLEHMFFKGTPTKTTKQINDEFSKLGADLNAYTSYDHTLYYTKIPSRNLRKSAELWKEILLNDVLDPIEFKSEKQVVLQEIQLYEDMPEFDVNYSVRKKHFAGTVLEHNILGTHDSVEAISADMMKDYIAKYYSLDNAIVTLVGGFDLESEKKHLASLFDDPIPQPRTSPIYPPKVEIDLQTKTNNITYYKKEVTKPISYVAFTWAAPGINSTDFYPLLLLNTLIGNSRTSLLYKEIISKGVTSVCTYGFEPLFDVSMSSIYFITPPNKTEKVFQKVFDLLVKVRSLKITPQSVDALKEETWGLFLSEIEDPTNYGVDLLQKFVKFRRPLLTEDFQKKIFQIDVKDIQNAKDRLLESLNMTVYSIGDLPRDWEPQFPKNGPW